MLSAPKLSHVIYYVVVDNLLWTYVSCDFTSSGISAEAKEKIAKVRWNTGTTDDYFSSDWTSSILYQAERSKNNGKQLCEVSGGEWCNDEVKRTTEWDGYIGLLYPSDYGYAVGSSIRTNCLTKYLNKYGSEKCSDDNWLRLLPGDIYFLLTPSAMPNLARDVLAVSRDGNIGGSDTKAAQYVYPTLYLKESLSIIPNPNPDEVYGSLSNPFIVK